MMEDRKLVSLGAVFDDAEGNEIGYTPAELKKLKEENFSNFDKIIYRSKNYSFIRCS